MLQRGGALASPTVALLARAALLAYGLLLPMILTAQPTQSTDLIGRFESCSPGPKMEIGKNAQVRWSTSHFSMGGDVGIPVTATGSIQRDGKWFLLKLDPDSFMTNGKKGVSSDSSPATSQRLYPVAAGGQTFLLDHQSFVGIVNHANQFYPPDPIDAKCYLHRTKGSDAPMDPLILPAEALLPPEYRKLLLQAPLHGEVLKVGSLSSAEINTGGWMRPPAIKTQYSAKLTINLGSADGVFVGMRLYVAPRWFHAGVESVSRNQSVATIHWIGDALSAEMSGMSVSSAALN
jgi:hypothetical protein